MIKNQRLKHFFQLFISPNLLIILQIIFWPLTPQKIKRVQKGHPRQRIYGRVEAVID